MFVPGEGEVIGMEIPVSAVARSGREIPSGHLLDFRQHSEKLHVCRSCDGFGSRPGCSAFSRRTYVMQPFK